MWDAVIIGGGLAGLVAGIRAAERGRKAIIISLGAGSLPYASGVLDFGNVPALLGKAKHPYRVIGENLIRLAFEYFLKTFPQYQGEWGIRDSVLTPLGELRSADLLPKWMSAGPLHKAKHILLLAPSGMKDFFPDLFKHNLAKSFPLAKVTFEELQVKEFAARYRQGRLSAADCTRFWHSEAGAGYAKEKLKAIKEVNGTEVCVVFPALGAAFFPALQAAFAGLSFPLVEITLFPPSPTGNCLYELFRAKFISLGGELIVGGKVIGAEVEDGVCRKLRLASAGKELSLTGRIFVLANGGLLGGGIRATPDRIYEPVFNLPLYLPKQWTSAGFVGEHPYSYTGVEVDAGLSPIDTAGRKVISNVKVCGRMIAHWDPWTEHCGGGVSLTTGLLAGELL